MIPRALMFLVCAIFVALTCNARPLQETRWQSAKLRPEWILKTDKAVFLFRRNRSRYEAIQKARLNGVPAEIIFALHYREADNDFTCHLANGDPLIHRTFHAPAGRIPGINPPYTFEQGAIDALYGIDQMQCTDWHNLGARLDAIESYNGTGYRRFHPEVPSPYLWSGTTIYTRGKYTADGRYSATAVDAQLGCVAILKRMDAVHLPFRLEF
ncbi:MAG: hypothetical protein ABI443_02440 [Chthoniobacterales bacterium]